MSHSICGAHTGQSRSPVSPFGEEVLPRLLAQDMHREVPCIDHSPSTIHTTLVVGRERHRRVSSEQLTDTVSVEDRQNKAKGDIPLS